MRLSLYLELLQRASNRHQEHAHVTYLHILHLRSIDDAEVLYNLQSSSSSGILQSFFGLWELY